MTDWTSQGQASSSWSGASQQAAAIQGGFLVSWTTTPKVTARLTSSSGNLSGLTAGSVTVYVVVDRFL